MFLKLTVCVSSLQEDDLMRVSSLLCSRMEGDYMIISIHVCVTLRGLPRRIVAHWEGQILRVDQTDVRQDLLESLNMGFYARMVREQMLYFGARWMSAPRPFFWGLPNRFDGPPLAAICAPPPQASESEDVIIISDTESEEYPPPSGCSTIAGVPVEHLSDATSATTASSSVDASRAPSPLNTSLPSLVSDDEPPIGLSPSALMLSSQEDSSQVDSSIGETSFCGPEPEEGEEDPGETSSGVRPPEEDRGTSPEREDVEEGSGSHPHGRRRRLMEEELEDLCGDPKRGRYGPEDRSRPSDQ